jgi:hypothetical protein
VTSVFQSYNLVWISLRKLIFASRVYYLLSPFCFAHILDLGGVVFVVLTCHRHMFFSFFVFILALRSSIFHRSKVTPRFLLLLVFDSSLVLRFSHCRSAFIPTSKRADLKPIPFSLLPRFCLAGR